MSNIVLTVLSALCCMNVPSLALGIVGIVFSDKCRRALAQGDTALAGSASRTARLMTLIGWPLFALAFVGVLILMAFYGAVVMAAIAEGL